ncbi:MYND-type domain-containing protein [Mycena sanguinolenta]|uniref:MYND-type domain-containing protein n=1 Tax=Mycena sanguinolenta TaxID=230812 RepID=A0A8H6Y4Y5_9AGAR|nr:MYND-type domain-containing protein [Mycena sanguinolenta]
MRPRRIKVFSFQPPDDISNYVNQREYMQAKDSILDYHSAWCRGDEDRCRSLYIQCSKYFAENPGTSLVSGAANGDGEKRLEIAIRRLSGCAGFSRDIEVALSHLDTIINPNNEDPAINVSAELLVKAVSCAAFGHLALYEAAARTDDIQLANDHLYAAAIYADAAVSRGLISSTSLWVPSVLSSSAEHYNVDIRNSPRYRVFKNLWGAWDKLDEELAAEERKRSIKVAKAPNAYARAADGCGVQGTSKTALLRCGGQCPPEYKPSYCSKQCQTRAWPAHKRICKPGSKKRVVPPSDDDPIIEVDLDDPTAVDNEISIEGSAERFIDFPHSAQPGGRLTIVSRHFSPVYLRYLRELMSGGTQ